MTVRNLTEAHALCLKNANGKAGMPDPSVPLTWDRETVSTIVTHCGRYRIVKTQDGARGVFAYDGYTTAGAIGPARHICGPFVTPKECRDAVQDFHRGTPMQGRLT